jgi:leucyl aminopeptidase
VIREVDCFFDPAAASAPGGRVPQPGVVHRLHAIRPEALPAFLEALAPARRDYLRFLGFTAKAASLVVLPPASLGVTDDGVAGEGAAVMDAVLGLGADPSHVPFGALPFGLPADTLWRLVSTDVDHGSATLGFGLGAYRFHELKSAAPKPARLALLPGTEANLAMVRAIWMGRDLINRPANLLGPAELAEAVVAIGEHFRAEHNVVTGAAVEERYPTIAAVGRGSDRPPQVAILRWRGSQATAASPLISLCGKGVCFDTGGYDLKPSSGMLRMKKDMGGAAAMMALASMIMGEDLPVRLVLRVGCVENSVSGRAMRPLDVIRTRSGKTVEVGNTDAEGRLVLCDLLDEAATEEPELLIDAATLTGAARTALGPDLPAMFCNDPTWAARLLDAGIAAHDPVWQLPLWDGYDSWLDSSIADLNNVSTKSFAGAIVAALFLKRFIIGSPAWIHFDLYAWNDQTRPAAPEGGEIQAVRAIILSLCRQYAKVATAAI